MNKHSTSLATPNLKPMFVQSCRLLAAITLTSLAATTPPASGAEAEDWKTKAVSPVANPLFFEDPHVARQHEADIQLLERSARIASERTMCVSDVASATKWIADCTAREAARSS